MSENGGDERRGRIREREGDSEIDRQIERKRGGTKECEHEIVIQKDYARGWYLPKLSLALIDEDLIEAEVVKSTNSRFKKMIFIVKDVTFI